ncbi:MFS transporter [Alteromonas aestuariivivens]|uniref:MFS transporter n=1 Tax=Alteromonas aestuariivivens TaxID=1938339 RepID=A0A3D8MBS0_9ALTE|nr:MFS transporter [Alteromonas aestuariivivens]RDV26862.1 MFS transporter [Alteromonas aestuariivivens]
MNTLPIREKLGYAMGDAAANLVWRGALAYLAVFYTDTVGLAASATALLFLIVRLSDGVTDIIMGMIADRTTTRWGRFRPWILFSTPFLALFMVLCFSTPRLGPTGNLVYAYVTYIGLILAYTANNVPYSALMGVMTENDRERTSLSGFRFAGAFLGGLLVMGFLPSLVAYFGQGDSAKGYQNSMMLFAALLMVFMLITVFSTKERIVPVAQNSRGHALRDLLRQLPYILLPLTAISAFIYYRNVYTALILGLICLMGYGYVRKWLHTPSSELSKTKQDVVDLITNKPWLILLAMGFLTMMFNGIKYGVVAYYFKYLVGDAVLAGEYFIALLVVSVFGALCTRYLADRFGRRGLFVLSLVMSSVLTCGFYWVPADNLAAVFVLGCAAEWFAAMMPTLFFSMLGDAADYSEWKNGRRATGLVYSAGTFVQKAGSGFAGALVLMVLAYYGYNGLDPASVAQAKPGMILLMSFIPAIFGFLGAGLMMLYPISEQQQIRMTEELITRRRQNVAL